MRLIDENADYTDIDGQVELLLHCGGQVFFSAPNSTSFIGFDGDEDLGVVVNGEKVNFHVLRV